MSALLPDTPVSMASKPAPDTPTLIDSIANEWAAAAGAASAPMRVNPLWQTWKHPSSHAQRVMMTLFEMLLDRGYILDPPYDALYQRVRQNCWVAHYWWRSHGVCIRARVDEKGRPPTDADPKLRGCTQVVVLTPPSGSLNIDLARTYAAQYQKGYRVVVVVAQKLTVHAADMLENKPWCEIWHESQLACNITRCAHVPQHVRLSDQERDKALQSLGADAHKLPRMLLIDPVRRYYRWPVMSVIQINRAWGGTSPAQIMYRIVCDAQVKLAKPKS